MSVSLTAGAVTYRMELPPQTVSEPCDPHAASSRDYLASTGRPDLDAKIKGLLEALKDLPKNRGIVETAEKLLGKLEGSRKALEALGLGQAVADTREDLIGTIEAMAAAIERHNGNKPRPPVDKSVIPTHVDQLLEGIRGSGKASSSDRDLAQRLADAIKVAGKTVQALEKVPTAGKLLEQSREVLIGLLEDLDGLAERVKRDGASALYPAAKWVGGAAALGGGLVGAKLLITGVLLPVNPPLAAAALVFVP